MGEQKVYVPRSSAKEITFQGGGSILKLSFRVDEFLEFVKHHKNSKGYINFGCSKRKEVGQYGDTHYLWLDTWEPGERQQPSGQSRPTTRPADKPSQPATHPPEEDDVPF